MNRYLQIIISCLILLYALSIKGQNLPDEMHFSQDGRRLITGNLPYSGFYESYTVHEIHLEFSQSDYWDDLEDNYATKVDLLASMTIDGVLFDSVGVRFKGSSSYDYSNADKKSFNISLDEFIPDQNVEGYSTLNLNNGYHDPSFMAEVLCEQQMSKHIPSLKGNFAHLFINGSDWGVYANIQQLNRDFTKEWFMSNDGAITRCKRPSGSPAPHGIQGDSLRTLYYIGPDSTHYVNNYTLKSSGDVTNPYERLSIFCKVMDTVSQSNMENILGDYLDIDRALWYLASENALADDDGYVYEGRTDYYVYYEIETGRFTPLEVDANGAMVPVDTNLSIFHQANLPNYSLMYKLLNNPPLRQRYLAHMRKLVEDELDTTSVYNLIDTYYSLIDQLVAIDPVQNYTYSDFLNHKNVLKSFVSGRRNYILNDADIDVTVPSISNTTYYSGTTAWQRPDANQDVYVNASVSCSDGINKVTLYRSTGIVGKFSKTLMFDDGLHHDQAAGDGIYGATIQGESGGTWVRFYIEATSNNSHKTVSYDPPGAEHDIYTYLVKPSFASDSSVVINELMAKNISTVTDSSGEYADWIELYNNSAVPKDISGYFLSDDTLNLIKWEIPQGTIIPANDFMIFWADDNEVEGLNHTNFKFDGNGEQLLLLNASHELVDEISFSQQIDDLGLARVPNGTGPFVVQQPTFDYNNNPVPLASFTTLDTAGCSPMTVSFTNNSTAATTYLWDFGDNTTSTFVSPLHTYTNAGLYTVTLTAINGTFSNTDSVVGMISVDGPTPFLFSNDTIFTSASTYNLDAVPGNYTYLWSGNETTAGIVVSTTGLYCVAVTDTNNCTSNDCVYIVLNVTGINEEAGNNSILIYPNPVDDYLILNSNFSKETNIEVFNSFGELMYRTSFTSEAKIETKSWAEGIYFLRTVRSSRILIVSH